MKYLFPVFFILALGCSDATSKVKASSNRAADANNADANNGASNDDVSDNADDEVECAEHEVLAVDRCLARERLTVSFDATTNFPQSFEDATACKWVVEDIEALAEYIDSNEVLAQTDDCVVTRRREERISNGITAGGNDFGEITVTGPGLESSVSEVIDGEFADDFKGCRTNPGELDFEYDTEYQVVATGGADGPSFELSATTPGEFDIECDSPVPGEDFVVEWTPVGAQQVFIESDNSVGVDPIEIGCTVADTGRFVIPAELTGFIQSEDQRIAIQGINVSTEVIDGVEVKVVARSWFNCFGQ